MTIRTTIDAIGENVRPICDRFWLFTIAALALFMIGGVIAVIGLTDKQISPEAMALLGSLATGLMMIVQKVIEAQAQRRLTEQLHQSQPVPQEPKP